MTPLTQHRRRAGTSLIEVVASMVILSAFLAAAVSTVGATILSQVSAEQRARGVLLAQSLMEEIVAQAYTEPFEQPVFGPEESEIGGNRAAFDDLDDYHGWSACPPQSVDGVPRAELQGWTREVAVAWVSSDNFAAVSQTETGIKRVTVTVQVEGKGVAELVMIVTESWIQPPYK